MIPPGGSGRSMGFEVVRATITGVGAGGICLARDALGKEREVHYDLRPKGTGVPAEGEIWVIRRQGEIWVLAAQVGATQPAVTGSRAGASALVLSLLAALRDLGLVDDQTTA